MIIRPTIKKLLNWCICSFLFFPLTIGTVYKLHSQRNDWYSSPVQLSASILKIQETKAHPLS
jgi:hypothetical protein